MNNEDKKYIEMKFHAIYGRKKMKEQDYGARLYLILILIRLKIMNLTLLTTYTYA
jgi:hypothetical protein